MNTTNILLIVAILLALHFSGAFAYDAAPQPAPQAVSGCYAQAQAQLGPQWGQMNPAQRAIVGAKVIATCEGVGQ